jgi:CyaY protein
MTDTEFLDLAEQALETLEDAIDELNETTEMDVDAQRVGGMITLVFANRSQIVVNLQKPLHEIWLAAQSGGYHYKWSGQAWLDTKTQVEFWGQLSADMTRQSGLPVQAALFHTR